MKRHGYTGLKPLARLVSDIATPIFTRAGFAKASIVLDWDKIVSPAFSQFCQAIKVTFPSHQKSQGVLHVRATSAMSLAISYQTPQILDCVNRYYGYQAIAKVTIHQGPLVARPAPIVQRPEVVLDPNQQTAVETIVETLPPGELREALQSLGVSVYKKESA
ncbi:MAG: DciA family protein [Alphaproteobacteria bacterium]